MKPISPVAKATAVALTAALAFTSPAVAHAASSDKNLTYREPGELDVPEQPALGSAYTGSAPLSIGIAVAVIAVVGQLVVDATPPLRQALDQAAAQAGLEWAPGSSEGNRIFDIPAAIAAWNNLLAQAQR